MADTPPTIRPARPIRRNLPPMSWPTAVLKAKYGEDSAGFPQEPRRVNVTDTANGMALPIVYGEAQVTAKPAILGVKSDGTLVVAYFLALGPIQQIVSWTINGHSTSGLTGVSTETFLGDQTTVSTILSGLISGYTQKLTGIAFIACAFSPQSDFFGGLPTIVARIKGRNDVYDPRTTTTGYSENPALCAAHFVASPDGCNAGTARVDWTSVTTAANHCDFNSSDKRYRLGLVLGEQRSGRENLNAILQCARLAEVYESGLWKLAGDFEGTAPVATITASDLLVDGKNRLMITETTVPPEMAPTKVSSTYLEPTRDWESVSQEWQAPGLAEGYVPMREQQSSATGINNVSVHARLMESNAMAGMFGRRLSLTTRPKYLHLERGDLVWVNGPLGISHNALVFNGSNATAAGSSAQLDLTTAGTIDCDFTCLAATGETLQIIYDRWNPGTALYGYGAFIVNATGALSLRFGAAAVNVSPCPNLIDGRLHRLRVSWSQNGRLIAWLDGVEIANVAGGASSATCAVATSLGYRLDGATPKYYLNGRISRFRVWNTARTRWECWRDLRRTFASPWPSGLVADFAFSGSGSTLTDSVNGYTFTLANTSWTTEGEMFRVVNARPLSTFLGVEMELREFSPNSLAKATVTSTSLVPVNRIDTTTKPSLPDATSEPPAPSGSLTLTVQEDLVGGVKRYKILAEWNKAPSGFVAGYRVTVSDGTTTRQVMDGSRTATSCVIDVLSPGVAHLVTVSAIGTNGKESSYVSGSVTPGGGTTVSVSLSLVSSDHLLAPWQTKGRTDTKALVLNRFVISLSGGSAVRVLQVLQDDHVIGELDPTCTSFPYPDSHPYELHFAVGNGRSWTLNDYPLAAVPTFWGVSTNGGNVIKVRAVRHDGQTVDSPGVTLPSSSYAGYLSTATAYARDLLAVASSERAFHSAVGSSPTSMRFPRTNSTPDWSWACIDGGVTTISSGSSYVTVTLEGTMPSTDYAVVVTAGDNVTVWVSDKTTTSFRLNRLGTTGSLALNWLAFRR